MSSILWYRQPATEWKDGLPVGNGVLAGMVMGGVECERVGLNHEWLWRGQHRFRDVEPVHQHPDRVRQLFFEGKTFEAGTLANEVLGGPGGVSGTPNRVDPYQPLGDLLVAFEHGPASEYRRELDLSTGVVTVEYRAGELAVRREVLAHATRRLLALRVTAAEGDPFSATLSLTRVEDPDCTLTPWASVEGFGLAGAFPEGISFAVEARLFLCGSQAIPLEGQAAVRVSNSRELAVLLAAAVDLGGGDAKAHCRAQLEGAPSQWAVLREEHIAVHRERFERVSLDLGGCERDSLPTDNRLAALRAGEPDEALLALYFNMGRYLLMASSWGAELPANLQGKWNEELAPPWDCDLHQDVNLQMNYWPAEVCNLAECLPPLFAHVERFLPHAREAARRLYGCEGIWLPIQTDPWGRATPESYGWDVWTGAGAWLAQHFWWRYEYSLDEAFLRERAYPLLKEVAAFYQTYLVRHPDGWLVPVPSQSPENTFVGGTSPVSLCVAATMDLQLIHDALTHAIRASEILEVDEGLRAEWRRILREIPPLRIGRHGQLQEWLEDYEEAEPGHRHLSHLFALFPGDQITLEETPELAAAARVAVERRLAHEGGHTGWSRSWTVCCFARLGDGERARQHLRALVGDFATDSLLDLHPPRIFQIDGNFGGTAGVAEMLLQSHRGLIRVLPALPLAWPEGKVTGLVARGAFELDIAWSGGRVREVVVRARVGGPCRIHFPGAGAAAVTCGGVPVETSSEGPDVLAWQTMAHKAYALKP